MSTVFGQKVETLHRGPVSGTEEKTVTLRAVDLEVLRDGQVLFEATHTTSFDTAQYGGRE